MTATRTALIALAALVALAAPAAAGRDRTADLRLAVAAEVPDGLGVVAVDVPKKLARARGEIALDWTHAPGAGWVSVSVTIGVGRRAVTGWVRVELGTLRPALIAMRPLRAGHVIAAGDLALADRPVAGLQIEPDVLIGARVERAVAADAVIDEDDVELPAATPRGAEVDVVVKRGALTVTARGALEHEARVGEPVDVRVATTHTILRGRLADASTVLIVGASP